MRIPNASEADGAQFRDQSSSNHNAENSCRIASAWHPHGGHRDVDNSIDAAVAVSAASAADFGARSTGGEFLDYNAYIGWVMAVGSGALPCAWPNRLPVEPHRTRKQTDGRV